MNYSQRTHHSQIVICNHFWQHHEQEQLARATAVFHVGSVILPLHLSQAACWGWAGGVTQPQGSRVVAGFTPQPGLTLCEPHCRGDVLGGSTDHGQCKHT